MHAVLLLSLGLSVVQATITGQKKCSDVSNVTPPGFSASEIELTTIVLQSICVTGLHDDTTNTDTCKSSQVDRRKLRKYGTFCSWPLLGRLSSSRRYDHRSRIGEYTGVEVRMGVYVGRGGLTARIDTRADLRKFVTTQWFRIKDG